MFQGLNRSARQCFDCDHLLKTAYDKLGSLGSIYFIPPQPTFIHYWGGVLFESLESVATRSLPSARESTHQPSANILREENNIGRPHLSGKQHSSLMGSRWCGRCLCGRPSVSGVSDHPRPTRPENACVPSKSIRLCGLVMTKAACVCGTRRYVFSPQMALLTEGPNRHKVGYLVSKSSTAPAGTGPTLSPNKSSDGIFP